MSLGGRGAGRHRSKKFPGRKKPEKTGAFFAASSLPHAYINILERSGSTIEYLFNAEDYFDDPVALEKNLLKSDSLEKSLVPISIGEKVLVACLINFKQTNF